MWNENERNEIRRIHDMAARGHLPEAIAAAGAALLAGTEHPVLLNLAALAREQAGQLDEALVLLDRALQLMPQDVACLNAKGLLLLRMERAADALSCFDRVVAISPEIPFGHVNRGNAMVMLGEMSKAEAFFRDALARDSAHPLALAGLASVASARGDHDRARTAALAALNARAGIADAVLALAAADLAENQVEEAQARVQRFLAQPNVTQLDRARGLVLLGDVFDAKGDHRRAFAEYVSANNVFHEIYAPRFSIDLGAADYARRLIKTLDSTTPSTWAQRRPDRHAVGHVFLIGFPRSGTTLLELILDGSAQISSLEEKESLIEGIRAFMRDPDDLSRLIHASEEELERYRDAYWDAVMAEGVSLAGKIFVDKYPLNTLKLPLIARLFPDAKIIFAVRDPRDVVLSCFRRQFKMSAPMYEMLTIEDTAAYYNAVMHLADRCLKLMGMTALEVRHEDLIANFQPQMDAVCRYLGLQWTSVMADFAERAKTRPQATPSTAQLARGLDRRTVQHWRHYETEMKPVLSTLSLWVERFGYDK